MARSRRRFLIESAAASAALLHPGLRGFAAEEKKKAKNPFLEGNFAPIQKEFTEEKLKVTGELPKALEGLFVRNGPNPQFDPLGNYHWFDGDAMLHGVRLQGGKASYRNRFIQTQKYLDEKKAGKALYTGILEMPDMKKAMKGESPFMNPANTALVWHAKKLLALYEVASPYEVKVPGLDTVGEFTYGGKVKHPFTAHPKVDPATGEMLTFGYVSNQPLALFTTISAKGEFVRTVKVKLDRPAMIHDFCITKNFAILPAWPQTFDMGRMLKGGSPWYFDKTKPTNFVLVPRSGEGQQRSFEAKTGFSFHLLNAYESGDEVVVIGCRYRKFPGAFSFGEKEDAAEAKLGNDAIPYRWRLNLKTDAVKEEALDEIPAEFPRHNDSLIGKELKYGYFGSGEGDSFGGLRKIDLAKGTSTIHSYGPGRFGGEGVFVPNPEGKAEDDGWLLTYLFDKSDDSGELLIADARDMKAKPVARVHLPTRIPYGLHGSWIPQGEL